MIRANSVGEGVGGLATRSKKKPVKRKPKTALPNRGLTTFGWIAAGLVGCGWAASDGRPARYLSHAVGSVRETIRPEETVDRVAALIRSEPKPRVSVAAEAAPPRSRNQPVPEDRTGSIRPVPTPSVPRPVATIVKPESASVPMPTKAPLMPLQAPPIEYALRQSRPTTPPSTSAPSTSVPLGEERHATRALAAHAAPDASSPTASQIASGMSVVVLRSAGDWRYVHEKKSGTEGWVDGRFLAGQSMASDLAALSHEDLTRGR